MSVPKTAPPSTTFLVTSEGLSHLENTLKASENIALDFLSTSGYLQILATEAIVLTSCCGAFTILAVTSVIVLIRHGLQALSKKILTLAVLALWASSIVWWAIDLQDMFRYLRIVQAHSVALATTGNANQCLLNSADVHPIDTHTAEPCHFSPITVSYTENAGNALQYAVPTVILTVDILVGDAIVWWRVWILWQRNWLILATAATVITADFALGVIDTYQAFNRPRSGSYAPEDPNINGGFYAQNPYGIAASTLTLASNLVATLLIGYMTWRHRRVIRGCLKDLPKRTQVERILTLLVESGSVYCIIWTFVLAYDIDSYITYGRMSIFGVYRPQTKNGQFLFGFNYFLEGCLIPLIGMYPTMVILLVTLNRSQSDILLTAPCGYQSPSTPTPLAIPLRPLPTKTTITLEGLCSTDSTRVTSRVAPESGTSGTSPDVSPRISMSDAEAGIFDAKKGHPSV
ncbi:hypothetical protein C8Q79DRAFT_433078 [Trametes meyenii]|nr:hypothetical protein C8Q79DRAFT_433078 [Trametes meyenii]